MKVVIAVLAALVVACDGKGMGTTRAYPPAAKSSNAYKYILGGAAVGAGAYLTYKVGSAYYRRHTIYDRRYDDHYNDYDERFRRQYPRRRTGCEPPGYERQEETDYWVHFQVIMGKRNFTATELHVDLFNELQWRSPCAPPTSIVIEWRCNMDSLRKLTDSDISVTSGRCQSVGEAESLPFFKQRSLLATTSKYYLVEFAIGADNLAESTELTSALRESVQDPNSLLKRHYDITHIVNSKRHKSGAGVLTVSFAALLLLVVPLSIIL